MNLTALLEFVGIATPILTVIAAVVSIVIAIINFPAYYRKAKLQAVSQQHKEESKYKVEISIESPSGKKIETKEIPFEEAIKVLRLLDDQQTHDRASLNPEKVSQSESAKAKQPTTDISPTTTKTNYIDVFFSYNREDEDEVKKLAETLKKQGIKPLFDEWTLEPGASWLRLLEQQIREVKAVAVFIGKSGIVSSWQEMELEIALAELISRGVTIIPVLLPEAPQEPAIPAILKTFNWVDLRQKDSKSMERLIRDITEIS